MKGVKIQEIVHGSGRVAGRGMIVVARLRLSLSGGDEIFADSLQERSSIIDLGKRDTLAGVRYGIEGMRVGGHRKLVISPHLAFGVEGIPGIVPPRAVLLADVALLAIRERGEFHPEDRPAGKVLHVFRPGESARSLARLQLDLHESGSCCGFLTVPVPGYGWRPARFRHGWYRPDMDLVGKLFAEALALPDRFPAECLAHEALWSDSSEAANGITRDRETETLCISITVEEAGERLRHYSMRETSGAWIGSLICRTLTDLMEPPENPQGT